MLKFLQSNRPSIVVLSLVLAGAMGVLMGGFGKPIASTLDWPWLLQILTRSGWVSGLFFGLVLMVQAVLLQQALNQGEVFGKSLPVTALVWVLIMGPALLRAPDPGLALGWLAWIMSLGHTVKVFRQQRVLNEVFRAAFWSGVAVVICPPLLPLVGAVVLSLAYSRSFAWEEWAVLFSGITLPLYIYLAATFAWTGKMLVPDWTFVHWSGLGVMGMDQWIWIALLVVGAVGLLLFLGGYGDASNRSRNSKNQLLFGCLALGLSGWFFEGERAWVQWNAWGFLLLPTVPVLLQPLGRARRILAWVTIALVLVNAGLAVRGLWV